MWKNTIVIITADHGEMGGSHGGLRGKGPMAYEQNSHVPFIVVHPDFPPGTTDVLTSHLDLPRKPGRERPGRGGGSSTSGFGGSVNFPRLSCLRSPRPRFRLELTDASATWIERNESGAKLSRGAQLNRDVPGEVRINRPNDDEVLAFLGFQPGIRLEILARSPKPSFMILTRNGTDLIGIWNGLVVIKNMLGRFQSMKQPGEAPVKQFVFKGM